MATANVSSESDDSGQLNCLLCFNKYKTPRVLPCLHSFCESCLSDYIKSNVKNSSESILCPVCKTICSSPNSKLPIDQWASSFPSDDMIVSVMRLEEDDNSSNFCDLCLSDGDNVQAVYWCSECTDKLCDNCHRHHKRSRTSKHHVTMPIEEMGEATFSKLHFDQVCFCGRGNLVETFCIDHQQMYCVLCSSTEHRQCKEIQSLDRIVKGFAGSNMTAKNLKDSDKMGEYVQKLLSVRTHKRKKINSDIENCVHDMEDVCRNLKEKIDTFERQFKNTAREARENALSKLEENENNIQSFRTNINNINQIIKILDQHGNPQQKFAIYRTNVSQLKSHFSQLETELQTDEDIQLTFKMNEAAQDMMDKVSRLGELTVSTSQSTITQDFTTNMGKIIKALEARMQVSSELCSAQIARAVPSTPTFVKSVSRLNTKREAFITCGTMLSNGNMLLADIAGSRLVELDDKYNFIREYNVDGHPQDITLHDDDIYVATNGYIRKYHVNGDKLTFISDINFTGKKGIFGIAISGNKLIAGTSDSVQVMSLTGSPISSTNRSKDNHYVAVSRTHSDILYYTDGNDVVCKKHDSEKYRYRHDRLESPRGLCVDNSDFVYVCGYSSQNVHQISPDGQGVRIIKLHNIKYPWAAVYNKYSNEIVISSYYGEDTLLEIYKL